MGEGPSGPFGCSSLTVSEGALGVARTRIFKGGGRRHQEQGLGAAKRRQKWVAPFNVYFGSRRPTNSSGQLLFRLPKFSSPTQILICSNNIYKYPFLWGISFPHSIRRFWWDCQSPSSSPHPGVGMQRSGQRLSCTCIYRSGEREVSPLSLWVARQKLKKAIYNHCHYLCGGSVFVVQNEGIHTNRQI